MNKLSIAITGLTLASLLLGCAQQNASVQPANQTASTTESPQDCQIIAHEAGETEICGQPQTVVTIGPNLLELLLALEVQPAGHAEYFPHSGSTFEQPIQQIPYLGERLTGQPLNVGTAHDPSLEAIAALKPDLILGDSIKNLNEYNLLSQIAPTLLFNYSDAERDWQSDLRAIATALNRTEQAEAVIANADGRIAKFRDDFQSLIASHPDVLLLLSEQLSQGVEVETGHSACGSLIEDLGFQLVVPANLKSSEQPSYSLSLETLPQLDADLIIIEGYNSDVDSLVDDPVKHQLQAVKQQWQGNAITQSMPASQGGQIYFTTTYLCHAMLGPIGTELFLNQLGQQLLSLTDNPGWLPWLPVRFGTVPAPLEVSRICGWHDAT